MGEGNAKGRTSEEVKNVRAMLKAVVVAALLGTILLASGQDDLAKCGEWRTLVIPFSEFRLGGWSQDENGRLDFDQIGSVIVGMHGTTSESEGRGSIWVASIAFVP